MNLFQNKILSLRENILHFTYLTTGIIVDVPHPDMCLETSHPIELIELTTSLSKF